MKKILLSLLYVVIAMSAIAQVHDDDKDGVPNSEDLCPNIAGTKANKGCPANKLETKKNTGKDTKIIKQKTNEFITNSNFNIIISAICNDRVKSQLHPDAPKDTNEPILTLLPKNGKSKDLPVYYQNNGNVKNTILLLSNNLNDFTTIISSIRKKIFESDYNCFQNKKYKTIYSKNKDTAYFPYQVVVNEQAFYISLYKLSVSKTEQYVALSFVQVSAKPLETSIKKISLANLIVLANNAAKENKEHPFEKIKTDKAGNIFMLDSSEHKQCIYQVTDTYITAVNNAGDEIIIQLQEAGTKVSAYSYSSPAETLNWDLDSKYKVLFKDDSNGLLANYDNIQISQDIFERDYVDYATVIFLRVKTAK